MSRSYRKAPIKSWAKAGRMSAWRRESNKRHRSKQKRLLQKHLILDDFDSYIPSLIREDSNVYSSPLDGGPGWFLKPHENSNFNPRTEEFDYIRAHSIEEWEEEFRK